MENNIEVMTDRKAPLEIQRTKTNFPSIVLTVIFLALWMGIAIFAGFPTNFEISFNFGKSINEEILKAGNIIIKFSAFTALMSMSYVILLKQYAKILVVTTISVFLFLLPCTICLLAYLCGSDSHCRPAILIASIILCIIFIPTIISIVVLRKNIQTAVEVLAVSSKIVVSFPSTLVFPILPCVLYVALMIFSQRTFYSLVFRSLNEFQAFFFIPMHNFGFLWFTLFITGWSQTVLSGCFCTWYWTTNKNYITNYTTISRFIDITTRYHLGTIACGSFVIILCKLIWLLLHTLGKVYMLLDLLLGYKLLFRKLENFMKNATPGAYILTSSHGTGFFQSAKNAQSIIIRNVSDALSINELAKSILILGQIGIISISASATYVCCRLDYGRYNDPSPSAVPLVIVLGIAITASIFMVLKAAIDSIMFCVLEDKEQNDTITEKSCYIRSDFKAPFLQSTRNF